MSENLIQVEGLTKVFRSDLFKRPHEALRGLALEVREGEIFGFLGPNGAGKTTTIKILLGLIRPSAGRGTVLGRPFGSVEARRELGFLPDAPNFYQYLTAREFLRFTGKLHDLRGTDLERRIDEVLDHVDLAPAARERQLRTYSRGMLQRTGIAAAILHRPRLVILDEPMNGLDPLGRRQFRDLILHLKQAGVTVMLSSHVLADIESTADRIGILKEGKLVRCGGIAEILHDDGRRVEIAFEIDAPALEEMSSFLDDVRPGARGWIGHVRNPDLAAKFVMALLDRGGKLLSFNPRRVTLEEYFLQETRGTGVPAAEAGRVPSSAVWQKPSVRVHDAPRETPQADEEVRT